MHYHKYRLIIPFLLPAILLYGVFVIWPNAQAIYVSLTSWRGVSGNKPFVGLENYQRLWDDERFHEALARNGQLLIVLPLVTIAIALTFAALFTQGSQQIRVYPHALVDRPQPRFVGYRRRPLLVQLRLLKCILPPLDAVVPDVFLR